MGIFEPYRALGYVTDGTPFSVQRRGTENFVTVSVGKAWQIYNCAKLTLVLVGPQLDKKIQALASLRDATYAATGRHICVFKRAHQVATWSAHSSKVILLLQFGQQILSIDADGHLLIWSASEAASVDSSEPVGELKLRDSFTPTCIMHPDTYLNKVLIGSEEGSLQMWNIKTCSLVHEFKGWKSPIHCCVSSPALDTVAIGCGNGKIYIHNLRYDETVVEFLHTSRGPITALSFRTDGQPFLAAGGANGVISIWNLEKRKLQGVVENAHDSSINSLHFLANEPVLLSAGVDNSLKMWIFDTSDGEARLLRFRSGHSAPPTCVRYYGNGRHILSAGQDRAFRVFSTIQDQQSRELSQGHLKKRARAIKVKEEDLKLPPVVSFDAVEIRERDWCNIVTCHLGENAAYSWRLQNFVIGQHVLRPSTDDPTPVKSCAISSCGNFAVLGTEGGVLERFNLQSGLSRGSYKDMAVGPSFAHDGAILGLACDSTNVLLTSGGYDGFLKVWDFKGRNLKSTLSVGSPVGKMAAHRGNGLIAVAADDKVLRLYDVEVGRLVRVFQGHTDRVTDLCFSEDGKLLLSAAMDATVRVWDVVAAKQMDSMHVGNAVTALSLSPAMDLLATSHVNRNGIYLWANRLMYSGLTDLAIRGSGEETRIVSMPTVSIPKEGSLEEDEDMQEAAASNATIRISEDNDEDTKEEQIIPSLITLTMLPKTQWKGLVNLDIIKIRNKPTVPPKKQEAAPFFLPTLPSLSTDPIFLPSSRNGSTEERTGQELQETSLYPTSRSRPPDSQSIFLELLYSCSSNGDYSRLVDFFKTKTAAEVDTVLRMMQIVDEDTSSTSKEVQEIGMSLDFLLAELMSNKNFQFVQALMQLFLKIHADTILRQSLLQEKARKLWSQQTKTWQRVDTTFQRVRCTINFVSNMQN